MSKSIKQCKESLKKESMKVISLTEELILLIDSIPEGSPLSISVLNQSLKNLDLKNCLQKQQQTLQIMANIKKLLEYTAMAIKRELG